jgi:hypothetical protein
MANATRKRLSSQVDDAPRKRKSRAKSAASRKKKTRVPTEADDVPAAVLRTPNNLQATLSGLPTELRLQIYSYLCESTIIHVHNNQEDRRPGASPFTWTPCRSPSSASPLLCANPKWSGMCEEEDRCTFEVNAPPEPMGFWALAASSKAIRNEMQGFFFSKTVISIHPHDLRPWLDNLAEKDPRRLDNLRRITLAGPNMNHYIDKAKFQLLRDRIPNLEGVGFQCQDSIWRWERPSANDVHVNLKAWKTWNLIRWMREFDPSIMIAMEAMICEQTRVTKCVRDSR